MRVEFAVPLATGVIEVKLNPQVTVAFTGAIEQVRPTAELNPFNEVTVMFEVVADPAIVAAEAGAELKLKLLMIKVYVVIRL